MADEVKTDEGVVGPTVVWRSIVEEPVREVVVLRGVLATAPRVYQSRRGRREPGRREQVAGLFQGFCSFCFSLLVHLLVVILLVEAIVIAAPEVGDAWVSIRAPRSSDPPAEKPVVEETTAKEEREKTAEVETAEVEPSAAPATEPAAEVVEEAPAEPEEPVRAIGAGSGVLPAAPEPELVDEIHNPLIGFSGEGAGRGGLLGKRRGSGRADAAQRHGGTVASEMAVERALDWLARHQEADGRWSPTRYVVHCPEDEGCGSPGSQEELAPGVTALATLAFLGAGYTHRTGLYAGTVSRALDYLLRCQDDRGVFRQRGGNYHNFYMHGVSTFALAEAYAMTKDGKIRKPLLKAVEAIVRGQGKEGGWDYRPEDEEGAEFTLSVWQMMGLKAAMAAGLEVPQRTIEMARRYIESATASDGSVRYRWNEQSGYHKITSGSTVAALFGRLMFGTAEGQGFERSLAYMERTLRRASPSLSYGGDWQYLYVWYYRTLVEFQLQGDRWRAWNRKIRPFLVAKQEREGHAEGMWEICDFVHVGTVYSTAMCALMLETYYRYEPLFTRGEVVDRILDASIGTRDDRSPLEREIEAGSLTREQRELLFEREKEKAVEKYTAMLASGSEFDRWLAVRRLSEYRDPATLEKAAEAARRETGRVKALMLRYLGEWEDPSVNGLLVGYVEDPDAKVRAAAMEALIKINKVYLNDPESWKRWWKNERR